MAFNGQASKCFNRAIERAGERINITADNRHYISRAVIQNSGKNFMRKYDNEGVNAGLLGRARSRDKVVFMPYFKEWETAEDVTLLWRGKPYIVIADSVMKLGDEPCYIWALIAQKNDDVDEDYYSFEYSEHTNSDEE